MDSRTGKRIRLSRLFDANVGKSLIVAFSHGSFIGPLPGTETVADLRRTAAHLTAAEGVLISPGLIGPLEDLFTGRAAPSLVVHLDWMNFTRAVLTPDRLAVAPLATVEEAAAAGADAVMTFLYYGDADVEAAQVAQVARIARACDRLGLALIVEPRSAREQHRLDDESDVDILVAFSRMSAEIGADIVKAVWRGPVDRLGELERVVAATPVPVFLAGGAVRTDFADVLTATALASSAGFKGLVYGRNIFQSATPGEALSAIREVFHGGASVQQALDSHPALIAHPGSAAEGESPSRY